MCLDIHSFLWKFLYDDAINYLWVFRCVTEFLVRKVMLPNCFLSSDTRVFFSRIVFILVPPVEDPSWFVYYAAFAVPSFCSFG